MKRRPALHLSQDDLEKILHEISYSKLAPKSLALELMRKAVPFNIKNRVPSNLDAKQKKKVDRIVASDNSIVEKFNLILETVRKESGHQRIKSIRKGDVDYTMLMEVSKMAYEFSEVFEYVPREDGYKVFCSLGIEMMGKKYGLNRFKYFEEKIYEKAEYAIHIANYEDKQGLQLLSGFYLSCVEEYGGQPDYSVNKDLTKLIYILWSKQMAEDIGAEPSLFIKAQFEEFKPMGFIPELPQLSTPKSIERYYKYQGANVKELEEIRKKNPTLDNEDASLFETAIQKALKKKKDEISSRKH